MKLLRTLLSILITSIIITSCIKEKSFESVAISIGTLKNSGDDCIGHIVKGVYKVGTALTTTNTIDVQVDVVSKGTYVIVCDEINGFSFKAEGTFLKTGINTVSLQGKGTPRNSSTDSFIVKYGNNNTCIVPITSIGANVTPAEFSYNVNSDGSCGGALLAGEFKEGVATNVTNSLKLAVNVTKAGTYTISIPAVDGVTFAASGMFANTGVQNVTLAASGTPIVAGDFYGTAMEIGKNCKFLLTVSKGNPPATYTLGSTGTACTGFTLAGIYKIGAAMTAANTASIEVNVTTVGSYSVSATAVNGVSFLGNGNFTITGPQIVTLTASGTPTTAGVKTFALTVGISKCNFDVTFEALPAPAVFTLSGAPNACQSALVFGTYQAATALTTNNTVTIKVNVTTAGAYNISTNTVNGIKFTGSGTFIATGTDISVILSGTGTPVVDGTFKLSPSVGNSSCTFDVIVVKAPVGAGIYNCKINGVFTSFIDRASVEVVDFSGSPFFHSDGYTGPPNGGNVSHFAMYIEMNDGSIVKPGTYDENHFIPPGTYRIEVDYFELKTDLDYIHWNTSSNLFPPPNPPFKIVITSITSTRIKGTFSGQLKELGSTAKIVITEGVFDLPIKR